MRKILNYALYDFANSSFTTIIITFIFSNYFAQQIVKNPILGQTYWGWAIGISGFAVALIGPFLGAFSDKRNLKVSFLRIFSIICIILTSTLWLAEPSKNYILFTLIVVGVANFFYELSQLFYNSLLKNISLKKNLGKSSGISFALGYIGGILVLLLSIKLFIDTENPILGLKKENSENIRAISFFVSLWFLVFSMPLLISAKTKLTKIKNRINLFEQIKKLIWKKGLNKIGYFFVARMLYADGLNAIIVMGGIFAVGVFQLSVKELLYLSILMNISAVIGATFGGYFNDFFGSKKIIVFSLLGIIISSILILFSFSKIYFFIFATINGLFIGPIQSASRVVIAKMLINENQSKGFGLFATSGKLTSFLGPILVSSLTFISGSQRIGFSASIFLLVIGLLLLLKIKNLD
tara:strand:- start:417 stop:1643 length:1227 start_codon:yes stop_codon:yes gene_type:complete